MEDLVTCDHRDMNWKNFSDEIVNEDRMVVNEMEVEQSVLEDYDPKQRIGEKDIKERMLEAFSMKMYLREELMNMKNSYKDDDEEDDDEEEDEEEEQFPSNLAERRSVT
ncbi:hypothetical protein DITRI_Ditri14bG0106700 [Diplodiscus trichospermus]